MEWYENYQITPAVQSAIKRANQRIVQTVKTFGKDSSIYKQNVGKFKKEVYKDFIPYYSRSKSGNFTFSARAINKAIRSGKANRSFINQFLAEVAGIKIDPEGNVVEIEKGGIPTVSEIEKKTKKKIASWGESPDMYTKQEIRNIAEELAEFSESFDTSYQIYMANFGQEGAEGDPVVRELYGNYRTSGHRLTYKQLQVIKDRMDEQVKLFKAGALDFEKDNTEEL